MNNLLIKIIVIFYFLLSFANAETLKKFEISGNKRISDQTIIIFSEIKINEEITKTKLDAVIKRLYKTSFFRDINLSFENQTLFLKVEENPIIEKLEITGIKKQSLVEFIKGKLQLAEMKSFDQNLLSSDINLIYNILKTNGYYFAKISSAKNLDETETPYFKFTKRDLAQKYYNYNLHNNLFPLTFSCIVNTEKHCGKCWWCKERLWAFGRII